MEYTPEQFEEWKRLWNEAEEVAYSLEEKQQLMLIQAAKMFTIEPKEALKQAGYFGLQSLWSREDIVNTLIDRQMQERANDSDFIDDVISRIEDRFDAAQGINWDLINYHIDEADDAYKECGV